MIPQDITKINWVTRRYIETHHFTSPLLTNGWNSEVFYMEYIIFHFFKSKENYNTHGTSFRLALQYFYTFGGLYVKWN